MSGYCGRLDPHAPHVWVGFDWDSVWALAVPRCIRECPGRPLIEGGNPAAKTWPR